MPFQLFIHSVYFVIRNQTIRQFIKIPSCFLFIKSKYYILNNAHERKIISAVFSVKILQATNEKKILDFARDFPNFVFPYSGLKNGLPQGPIKPTEGTRNETKFFFESLRKFSLLNLFSMVFICIELFLVHIVKFHTIYGFFFVWIFHAN